MKFSAYVEGITILGKQAKSKAGEDSGCLFYVLEWKRGNVSGFSWIFDKC